MTLLASASYDPASAATAATTSLLAMTALDTTNLRLTFTAPASGTVVVRARVALSGSTTTDGVVLLGVLEGATVKLRAVPAGAGGTGLTLNAANTQGVELVGIVSGLSAGSHTWDLAYGVEAIGGSGAAIKWGGPNDATGADAWGAATFEVYDAGANLLASASYDPSTAGSLAVGLRAMTAIDTTNLRLTFTAPASGNVFWRLRTVITSASTAPFPGVMLGVMESTAVVARQSPCNTIVGASTTNFPYWVVDASGIITGISAGSHSYDAAIACQVAGGSTNYRLHYGGPNNTTANDGYGAILFSVWAA